MTVLQSFRVGTWWSDASYASSETRKERCVYGREFFHQWIIFLTGNMVAYADILSGSVAALYTMGWVAWTITAYLQDLNVSCVPMILRGYWSCSLFQRQLMSNTIFILGFIDHAMVLSRLDLIWGKHNFEFRSVSRIHERWGWAELISISHFTTIFTNFRGYKCWKIKLKMTQVSFHI